jgi:hypothetical protein
MSATAGQRQLILLVGSVVICLVACRPNTDDRLAVNGIAPVYNPETGKLEQLLSDRDHDGVAETRAFMDGGVIKRIEIDRNHDGKPDRWEYYGPPQGTADPASPGANVIDHAEEANGPSDRITRREFYAGGAIARVVDDADGDGRADKWEEYEHGLLVRVDVDTDSKGRATRRLHYDAAGNVTRIETDADGDGHFESSTAPSKAKR